MTGRSGAQLGVFATPQRRQNGLQAPSADRWPGNSPRIGRRGPRCTETQRVVHTGATSLPRAIAGPKSDRLLARRSRTAPAVRDKTGATPHFVPLARHGEWGVSGTVSGTVSDPPLAFGEVAPVCMYPCGKAPRPARGPDDQQRRAARRLTDASARSWSSAASVSRPPGRGPARFPRPIPWRCSSATTPRTCIAPSSRGTTSRPAWPCSSPANCSSAHPGSGSPGWASV